MAKIRWSKEIEKATLMMIIILRALEDRKLLTQLFISLVNNDKKTKSNHPTKR